MVDTAEMPRYKCHKEVHALQIERIVKQLNPKNDSVELHFIEEGFASITIEDPEGKRLRKALMDNHYARIREAEKMDHKTVLLDTGYLVVYADGYRSWSPKDVFEDGYARIGE